LRFLPVLSETYHHRKRPKLSVDPFFLPSFVYPGVVGRLFDGDFIFASCSVPLKLESFFFPFPFSWALYGLEWLPQSLLVTAPPRTTRRLWTFLFVLSDALEFPSSDFPSLFRNFFLSSLPSDELCARWSFPRSAPRVFYFLARFSTLCLGNNSSIVLELSHSRRHVV